METSSTRFPSPIGESILITITKWRGSGMSQKVSVPYRGFNSHYHSFRTPQTTPEFVSVPSRGFNSHYSVAARPHKHWPEKPVCGAKPISVTSIDYYRSLCPKNPINTACGSNRPYCLYNDMPSLTSRLGTA